MHVLWNEFSETKTSHLILSAKAPEVGRWSTYKITNEKGLDYCFGNRKISQLQLKEVVN